jgi:hypothetical protein
MGIGAGKGRKIVVGAQDSWGPGRKEGKFKLINRESKLINGEEMGIGG